MAVVVLPLALFAVVAGTLLQSASASDSLTGKCTKADVEGSSFDKGRTQVEWFPPAIHCSWNGRYPDERWFPTAGIAFVGLAEAACVAIAIVVWWLVRRADRTHRRAIADCGH